MRSPSAPSHYSIPFRFTYPHLNSSSLSVSLSEACSVIGLSVYNPCTTSVPPQDQSCWVLCPPCPWPSLQSPHKFLGLFFWSIPFDNTLPLAVLTTTSRFTSNLHILLPVVALCELLSSSKILPVKRVWSSGNPVLTTATRILILQHIYIMHITNTAAAIRNTRNTSNSSVWILAPLGDSWTHAKPLSNIWRQKDWL